MTSKTHLVFVYGSLKTGFHNHMVLNSARKVMDATTTEPYIMASLGAFPGVLEVSDHEKSLPVQGEVYYVNDQTMRNLDVLEGNGTFYQRKEVSVEGMESPVWMYFFLGEVNDPYLVDDFDGRVFTDGGVYNWG